MVGAFSSAHAAGVEIQRALVEVLTSTASLKNEPGLATAVVASFLVDTGTSSTRILTKTLVNINAGLVASHSYVFDCQINYVFGIFWWKCHSPNLLNP